MQSIKVEDFGPIARAEVALSPLTVFIGANNTGKSYLALAIYSLIRAVAAAGPLYGSRWSMGLHRMRGRNRYASSALNDILIRVGDDLPDYREIRSGLTAFRDWPSPIQDWILRESHLWPSSLSQEVDSELRRCFGSSLQKLGRREDRTHNGEFKISLRDNTTGFNWEIRSATDDLVTDKWEPTKPDASQKLPPMFYRYRGLNDGDDAESMARFLLAAYSRLLFTNFSSPIHYLPAAKTGILVGHKTLSSLIVAQASAAWIEPIETERLPGVVTDLIRSMLLVERSHQVEPHLQRIVDFLEGNVVKGSVDIERQQSGYPAIVYTNDAGVFQLHEVASSVSETAPLILFLKYFVKPGDLIILEEPEAHLDPGNQRHIARSIVRLINAGVRVLVTTHSDVLLNQLINLAQASQATGDFPAEAGYDESELLSPQDICAYLFRQTGQGTEVEPLPVYPDEGLLTESFSAVHRALYDETIVMEYGE